MMYETGFRIPENRKNTFLCFFRIRPLGGPYAYWNAIGNSKDSAESKSINTHTRITATTISPLSPKLFFLQRV